MQFKILKFLRTIDDKPIIAPKENAQLVYSIALVSVRKIGTKHRGPCPTQSGEKLNFRFILKMTRLEPVNSKAQSCFPKVFNKMYWDQLVISSSLRIFN